MQYVPGTIRGQHTE